MFASVKLFEKLGLEMTLCSAIGIKQTFAPPCWTCLFWTLSIVSPSWYSLLSMFDDMKGSHKQRPISLRDMSGIENFISEKKIGSEKKTLNH